MTQTMRQISLRLSREVGRPASEVWAVVADYDNDPLWRAGVATMAPDPSGVVGVGTTTREVMRFAGQTYRNGGVVTSVDLGRAFTWRTTSGIDAEGGRSVEPVDARSCVFTFHVRIRPRGAERWFAPLLRWMLVRAIRADIRRLERLARD